MQDTIVGLKGSKRRNKSTLPVIKGATEKNISILINPPDLP